MYMASLQSKQRVHACRAASLSVGPVRRRRKKKPTVSILLLSLFWVLLACAVCLGQICGGRERRGGSVRERDEERESE